MNGRALKKTLLTLALAGCTISAYATTISRATLPGSLVTVHGISERGSFSATVTGWDDSEAGDVGGILVSNLPPDFTPWSNMGDFPPSDPVTNSPGDDGGNTIPVPEASDAAMIFFGLALLGATLRRRRRLS